MTRLFNEKETVGKTVRGVYRDSGVIIYLFTDDTFIKFDLFSYPEGSFIDTDGDGINLDRPDPVDRIFHLDDSNWNIMRELELITEDQLQELLRMLVAFKEEKARENELQQLRALKEKYPDA